MKLGIYGGTFNPIHVGHLIVAEEVRQIVDLEKIIFVPSGRPPHKDESKVINPIHRYRMTELAIKDNAFFDISDMELKRAGKSYTIDTIQEFNHRYRNAEIHFIIGADSALELDTWKKPVKIAAECRLVATTRPGFDIDNVRPFWRKRIKFVRVSDIGISGTDLRYLIRKGKSIRYKVQPDVEEYIYQHKLYEE